MQLNLSSLFLASERTQKNYLEREGTAALLIITSRSLTSQETEKEGQTVKYPDRLKVILLSLGMKHCKSPSGQICICYIHSVTQNIHISSLSLDSGTPSLHFKMEIGMAEVSELQGRQRKKPRRFLPVTEGSSESDTFSGHVVKIKCTLSGSFPVELVLEMGIWTDEAAQCSKSRKRFLAISSSSPP